MKLSRERQIFLAVLGLGLAGLAVDRLFLAPSTAASPDGVTIEKLEAASSEPAKPPLAKAKAPAGPVGPSFAIRLAKAAENRATTPSRVRDAFTPGPAWGVKLAKDLEAPSGGPGQFLQAYKPQLVFRSLGRAIVKVGARQCRIGDSVDGWVLSAVGKRSVTFSSGAASVEVPLSEGPIGHTASRAGADNSRIGDGQDH